MDSEALYFDEVSPSSKPVLPKVPPPDCHVFPILALSILLVVATLGSSPGTSGGGTPDVGHETAHMALYISQIFQPEQ